MAKKRNLNKGFGGRKQQPKQHALAVVLHFILSPVVVAPINLLLASLCSILAVMIITRYGDTKYMTSLSPRDLLPAFLPALGGIALKILSKKSFKELWGSFVTTYGKRWTLTLIILTSVLAMFLSVISQHSFWMKRAPADLEHHEILVLLAKFRQVSGNPLEPNEEWGYACEKIKDTIKDLNLSCVVIPQEVGSDVEAKSIGDIYQARLVVWGTVRAAVVEANYTEIQCGCSNFVAHTLVTGIMDQLRLFVSRDGGDTEYILNVLAGQLYDSDGNNSRALEYYNRAIKLLRQDRASSLGEVFLLSEKGVIQIQLGKIDEGLVDLNRAIQLYPDSSVAYHARGVAYEIIGKGDLAVNDYTKAIELDPNNFRAYNNRGRIYGKMGKLSLALVDLNRAIEIKGDAGIYSNRASIYKLMGNYSKALLDYNQAISLEPKVAQHYANRGTLYARMHLYDLAIADFSKTIEVDSAFYGGYANLGSIFIEIGRYEEAVVILNKAIELAQDQDDPYLNRAAAYRHLGKNNLAISDLTKVIQTSRDDKNIALAYFERGKTYASLGQYQKALDSLQPYLESHQNPSTDIARLVEMLKKLVLAVP